MSSTIETGNAAAAGQDFRGWLVGDLRAWAAQNGVALPHTDSPRQSSAVQVKWFNHPPGDARKETAPPDQFITLGILISGAMLTEFTSASGERTTVSQSEPGDYVIWHGPSYSHRWHTFVGATVVTIRWPVLGEHVTR